MATGDVTAKTLGGPVQLDTSDTAIVSPDTITGNVKTLKQIVICNTDGTERWVTIGVDGTSASQCIMFQLPIAAYDTIVLDTALTLTPVFSGGVWSGYLYGKSDTASKVTVTATGWEMEL